MFVFPFGLEGKKKDVEREEGEKEREGLMCACRNLTKTLDYLEVFARFKDEENIKAVERLLNSHTELEMFERSQLGIFPLAYYIIIDNMLLIMMIRTMLANAT